MKANQPGLLAACQRRSRYPAQDTHRSLDKAHGKVVERTTRTFAIPAQGRGRRGFWPGCTTVVHTARTTHRKGRKPTTERAFHVLTSPLTAAKAAALIRGHWSIENNLHGTRDCRFREDACTASGLAAVGYAWLRTLAQNTLAAAGRRPDADTLFALHEFDTLIATVWGK